MDPLLIAVSASTLFWLNVRLPRAAIFLYRPIYLTGSPGLKISEIMLTGRNPAPLQYTNELFE